MTDTELSKAVADACGIEVEYGGSYYFHRGTYSDVFDPPNDWNDAMLAAEKFGLFENTDIELKYAGLGLWWITDNANLDTGCQCGPRAICEAILAIAKGTA